MRDINQFESCNGIQEGFSVLETLSPGPKPKPGPKPAPKVNYVVNYYHTVRDYLWGLWPWAVEVDSEEPVQRNESADRFTMMLFVILMLVIAYLLFKRTI